MRVLLHLVEKERAKSSDLESRKSENAGDRGGYGYGVFRYMSLNQNSMPLERGSNTIFHADHESDERSVLRRLLKELDPPQCPILFQKRKEFRFRKKTPRRIFSC